MTPDPLPNVPLKSLKLGSRALLQSLAVKRFGLRQTPLGLEERSHVVEASQSIRVVFAQFGFAWTRQTRADCTDCMPAQKARSWKPTMAIQRTESHTQVVWVPILTIADSFAIKIKALCFLQASNRNQCTLSLCSFKIFAMMCFGMKATLGTFGDMPKPVEDILRALLRQFLS